MNKHPNLISVIFCTLLIGFHRHLGNRHISQRHSGFFQNCTDWPRGEYESTTCVSHVALTFQRAFWHGNFPLVRTYFHCKASTVTAKLIFKFQSRWDIFHYMCCNCKGSFLSSLKREVVLWRLFSMSPTENESYCDTAITRLVWKVFCRFVGPQSSQSWSVIVYICLPFLEKEPQRCLPSLPSITSPALDSAGALESPIDLTMHALRLFEDPT